MSDWHLSKSAEALQKAVEQLSTLDVSAEVKVDRKGRKDMCFYVLSVLFLSVEARVIGQYNHAFISSKVVITGLVASSCR